ncbi:MAG: type II toxin-antitoxin system RelE/ParE family toxin [Gemmatimonadales bacterium]|nr:type II toxin-antitoxin system RelE/ParE family toxin [Gemmatimonadales bacterium]
MRGKRIELEFIYTPLFERSIKGLLDDEAMRLVERLLLEAPETGNVVAGTGGVRKIRVGLPGRGKRGGGRVIYFYVAVRSRIYFLLGYAKNRAVDLTPLEKRVLRTLASQLQREE